ncbi:BLUF domain-containing protein [Catalinimonas sp. 4WD22]|uniref:BLUF domain-containing protein n=1 Tax=Catalinimonas locisalis TaxID=3133978 RepID=UPI003100CB07
MLHDLYALAYISIALEEFDKPKLVALANHANQKNKRLDVSGYLCFKHNMFFQYLEGSKINVIGLMNEIELDSRHQVINEIHFGHITERKFLGWSMRYLDDEQLRNVNLEDMLKWIFSSMKTESSSVDLLKNKVQSMIDQIKVLRGKNVIS